MASLRLKSETELLSLLKTGDHNAFAELYERYKGPLYIHAFNLLREREGARDVLQQVFTDLWDTRETLEVRSQLAGYLFTVTRNKILKLIAHQSVESRYMASLAGFAEQGECPTDHQARERQLWEIIDREVAQLPEKMRLVFELSRKGHLTHKEIAEQLNISEKTVRNQVNNALKVIRLKLGLLAYLAAASQILHR